MLKHRLRVLLIISVLLLTVTQLVWAENEEGINIYNTRLITSDKDATFIEGDVSKSCGQSIVLKAGFHEIAEKKMPDTGMPSKFKIKVPAENISDENIVVLFVKEKGDRRASGKSVRVELEYKERQKQEITTASKEYKLTFPGYDSPIKAKATSGEKLIYSSSNPEVATVDENGNLTAVSEGEAEIKVKQIGSSAYEEAEKTVKVAVEEIDAYSVIFHASDETADNGGKEITSKQIIERGSAVSLDENAFENADHEFLGWATSDDGLMEYPDATAVTDLAEKGEDVDLYAVWSGDGVRGAIAWAENIAADNSFSYGHKPQTSKLGCYFCGTNQRKKPKGYEKTYVCMTFITAAYAHGAEDPELYRDCSTAKHCITETNTNFSHYSCWKKVGLAKNLSLGNLLPGDVIVYYSANNYSGHVCMYIGNNNIVDAEGIRDCWGPNSIAVRYGKAASMLRSAGRFNGSSYVMRYVGPNA